MSPEEQAFLQAINDLDEALDHSLEMTGRMKERIHELRDTLTSERSLREIVPREQRPLLVQLLTVNAELLHRCGNRVRRTEAHALHREGLTMDEIARLFGVSRQRVSALLRDPPSQN